MNKIRGSFFIKFIAWIICVSCAVTGAAAGIIAIWGDNQGYFDMSREKQLENAYSNANALYSLDAYNNMQLQQKTNQLAQEGFFYGIFQTEDIAKVDFKDSGTYLDTNISKEQLQNIDTDKLYLYLVIEMPDGSKEGHTYDFAGSWSDLSSLQKTVSELKKSKNIEWIGQYADAICYERRNGIFYYRSNGYYYPAQNVSLYYDASETGGDYSEYNYTYNYEKKKYVFNYCNADSEISVITYDDVEIGDIANVVVLPGVEVEQTTEAAYDDVDKILRGDSEKLVDFTRLDNTGFNYGNWQRIVFEQVREISAGEFEVIDADAIEAKYFFDGSTMPDYFLDENYTLQVASPKDVKYFWIASLLPDTTAVLPQGSRYAAAAKSIELFYDCRGYLGGLIASMIVLTLASFAFLAYAAGHRRDKEGIALTWFDKIPLEIILAIAFFAEALLAFAGVIMAHEWEKYNNFGSLLTPLMLLAAEAAGAIALWIALSFCVRVKNGKWWRNTICYRIWAFFGKTIKGIYSNISLLWKLLLILFVKALLELFAMAAFGVGSGMIVFLWLIETVIIGGMACRAAVQVKELDKAAEKMAEGNLAYKADTKKMYSACKKHGDNLNKISDGMSKAVDERLKSERFKTELITNVSHDIKTPLTSIINYVDLLGKQDLDNEKAREYIEVLERQSLKLKKLIEDLMEASKASTGNLAVNSELLEVGVFLTQTVGEFEEKLSLTGLELIVEKPEEPVHIMADGRHLWRVVDNLMSNICKYSQPSSRVYVNLEKEDGNAVIIFRNISRYQLNVSGSDLAERFIRGDKSRNTEGYGLGLSIAKSLMDLIGGEMEIVVDGDLFKVVLRVKAVEG